MTETQMADRVELQSPAATVMKMAAKLQAVATETVDLSLAAGRVLAQDLVADRDSPACDVSAAEGYALRLADLSLGDVPLEGQADVGQSPKLLAMGKAMKMVTGAAIPKGAELVIRCEDVEEHGDHIRVPWGVKAAAGNDIRARGQNIRAGEVVVEAGRVLTPALVGALASFGLWRPRVHRVVRLGIVVTGDELLSPDCSPSVWQVRDSNGPAVEAMLGGTAWLDWQHTVHVADDVDETRTALTDALQECDVVLITGGAWTGDHDCAQEAVSLAKAGVEFRGLPIRPGKAMFGAIGLEGQAILGLPGDPVSLLVTARRLGAIVLRRLAGFGVIDPPSPMVVVDRPEESDAESWLYRPVTLGAEGGVQMLPTKGPGDLVSAGRSDGFVEIPPRSKGEGKRAYFPWGI